MATKHGEVVIYRERLQPLTNVKSFDNLKILYLHFHKTCGHQTWQSPDFGEKVRHANASFLLNSSFPPWSSIILLEIYLPQSPKSLRYFQLMIFRW